MNKLAIIPLLFCMACGATDGKIGNSGKDGKPGDRGSAGFPGSQGPMGPSGFPGAQGRTGNDGKTGPQGQQGYPGAANYTTALSNARVVGPLHENDGLILCAADYTSNDNLLRARTRNTFLTINGVRAATIRECPTETSGRPKYQDGMVTVTLCGYEGLLKAGDKVSCIMQLYGETSNIPNIVSIDPKLAVAFLTAATSPEAVVQEAVETNARPELKLSVEGVSRKKTNINYGVDEYLFETKIKVKLDNSLDNTTIYKQCNMQITPDVTPPQGAASSYPHTLRVDFSNNAENEISYFYLKKAGTKSLIINAYCFNEKEFAILSTADLPDSKQKFEIPLDSIPLLD